MPSAMPPEARVGEREGQRGRRRAREKEGEREREDGVGEGRPLALDACATHHELHAAVPVREHEEHDDELEHAQRRRRDDDEGAFPTGDVTEEAIRGNQKQSEAIRSFSHLPTGRRNGRGGRRAAAGAA